MLIRQIFKIISSLVPDIGCVTLVLIVSVKHSVTGLFLGGGAPILIHCLYLGGALLVCGALAALGGDWL